MEQDGRQPVWPPHYIVESGNNAPTYPSAEQDDPMQHNGVSSSEGLVEQRPRPFRPYMAGYEPQPSGQAYSDNEPQSTVRESDIATVAYQAAERIPATPDNEAVPVQNPSTPDSSLPPDSPVLHQMEPPAQSASHVMPAVAPVYNVTVPLENRMGVAPPPPVVEPDVEQPPSGDVLVLISCGSGGIVEDAGAGPSSASDNQFEGRRSTRLSQLPSTSGLNAESMIEDDQDLLDEEEFLKQGALQTISDNPVISRARASLPSQLQIFKVENNEVGVFAKRVIPKRTQFGPMEGKILRQEFLHKGTLKWLVKRDGQDAYLDCSDEQESNWMGFIRPAKRYSEQNLIAFQLENSIYFATIKSVEPKTELKVWYAKSYAELIGEKVLEITAEEAAELQDKENSWPCFECSRKFRTSELLQKHLATHDALHSRASRGRPRGRRGRPRKYPEGYQRKQLVAQAKLRQSRRVQRKKPEQFNCNMCPKSFPRLYSLQRHMVMHSGEKNFTCNICNKTFAHIYNRTRHLRRHEEKGEYPGMPLQKQSSQSMWGCDSCDLEFESEELLNLHELTHSPSLTDPEWDEGEDGPMAVAARLLVDASSIVSANHAGETSTGQQFDPQGGAATPVMVSRSGPLGNPLTQATSGIIPMQISTNPPVQPEATIQQQQPSMMQPSQQPAVSVSFQQIPGVQEMGQVSVPPPQYPNQNLVANTPGQLQSQNVIFPGDWPSGSNQQPQNQEGIIPALPADSALRCPECNEVFQNRKFLALHASAHGKNRPVVDKPPPIHRCGQCSKVFKDKAKYERHLNIHSSDAFKPLQCNVCGKRFMSNSAIACHMKVHSGQKYYKCPFCEEGFDRMELLRNHVPYHSVNGMYTCPHCGKQFRDYPQIRKHIRGFHSQKEFPCPHCDRIFPRPDKLKLHMLRHSDHKDFLCANCGKQFKRKDKLKEHMHRMHNPQREAANLAIASKPRKAPFKPKFAPTDINAFTFKCRLCSIGFKRRGMLVNHLAKQHPETPPESVPELNLPIVKPNRNYFCAYCEKVYKSSSKRKIHILKNHPGSIVPPSLRKTKGDPNSPLGDPHTAPAGTTTTHYFACAHCPRQYSTKAKMMDHVRKKHMEPVQTMETSLSTTPATVTVLQQDGQNLYQEGQVTQIAVVAHVQDGMPETVYIQEAPDYQQVSEVQSITPVALTNHVAGQGQQPILTSSLHGQAAHVIATIAAAAQEAAQQQQNNQDHQIIRQPELIRYIDTTNTGQGQSEAVQADLLTQAMSELSQSIEFRQQPVGDYQHLTQRIIQHAVQPGQQIQLQPQTIQVTQIPVSQIPVTQVTNAQIPVSHISMTPTSIAVSQIPVTYVTQSATSNGGISATQQPTVDVSQLRQTDSPYQPQLLNLQNSVQPMSSPIPMQQQQQQQDPQAQQQQTQQQQQPTVYIQRTWANYQPQYR
ncbi:PR domain zinc finger protein 10-like [Asterias amurensis]|uniref:PR domain zinc finger protein 10-like n=1 Tax=Asterias amurensis TaxID=7602 RepID=UPI003AB193CA